MNPALLLTVGLTGSCVGSYVATAALRAARAEQSLAGRSRCDACGVQLSFAHMVPVLSFVGQGGACANCHAKIDPIHLVGEVGGALIAVGAFAAAPPLRAGMLALLGLVLLATSIRDWRTRRLPDNLTLTTAIIAAGLAAQDSYQALGIGCLAALISFVLLEGVRLAFRTLRGEPALGFGDVKLISALALWLGVQTPWALTLAAVLGLASVVIQRPSDGRIAFGPYLAMAAWTLGLVTEVGAWPA